MRARGERRRLLLSAALLAAAVSVQAAKKELVVTFLDCGQGDAAVVRLPGGKTALIDGGPVEEKEFDAGRDVVGPFLKANGIRKVDYLVMSHPHLDHIGGVKYVLENFDVGLVMDPGYSYPSPDYKDILEIIKTKNVDYQVVRSGKSLNWDPAVKVKTLSPPSPLPWDDPNDNSLVVQLAYDKVSFLFMGDAEGPAEYEMVIRHGPALKTTILKVGHHGSTTSSKPEFLDHVAPEVAIISCGRFNRFRHPNKKTLSRFEDYGIKVYRTDTQGHIVVSTDGKKYKVEPQGFSGN